MRILWLSAGESEVPADDAWLAPGERDRAGRMRFRKRLDDYRLGRQVTKRAVAKVLGLAEDAESLRRIEVRNADDGAPEVLLGGESAPVTISISDRAGWGVCAVGLGRGAVGCDLELVEPRSETFVNDYMTARERVRVAAASDAEARDELANLLWCAKESALKVLHCGLRRDTRSAEVELLESAGGEWGALRISVGAGRVLPGWWRRFGTFLLTVCAETQSAPPVSLCEPAGLETARPSHAWLEAPRVAPAGPEA